MTDTPLPHRCRLYLITPPRIAEADAFLRALEAALDAGDIACLQLRLKAGEAIDEQATRQLGARLVPMVQARGIAVVINDSPQLALELGADGVHLGPGDMTIGEARALLGPEAIIGASAKASRHMAFEAGEAGADYVAFGAFFPTITKAGTTPADLDLLTFWQEAMELPCVAIGGITPDNARPLIEAGADFLAVSSGVWDHPEGPAAAVRAFHILIADSTAGGAAAPPA